MGSVEAVACDMNYDFEDASRRSVPELSLCSTTFYIIKNFNNKVVSAIRKDKERRLYEEGLTEEERPERRLTTSLCQTTALFRLRMRRPGQATVHA